MEGWWVELMNGWGDGWLGECICIMEARRAHLEEAGFLDIKSSAAVH